MSKNLLQSQHLGLHSKAETLANRISSETLHFEWVDSEFVRAHTSGEWLLIEDVDACR